MRCICLCFKKRLFVMLRARKPYLTICAIYPHYLTGVPRVWEKVYSTVNLRMQDATALGKAAYAWAVRQGELWAKTAMVGAPTPLSVRLRYWLANQLVLANMRRAMGMDQVKRANSGAAPVSPDLLKWFWAMGVPIFEGWGQTETMAIGTVNVQGKTKSAPLAAPPPTAVRIDPETDEIQIQAPIFLQGISIYLKKRQKPLPMMAG